MAIDDMKGQKVILSGSRKQINHPTEENSTSLEPQINITEETILLLIFR